jgi:multisubunit Na+/H+ antiporter MnhF subunit
MIGFIILKDFVSLYTMGVISGADFAARILALAFLEGLAFMGALALYGIRKAQRKAKRERG